MQDPRTRIAKAGAAGAMAVSALALAPAQGQAAPAFRCEASAVRATIAGQAAIEPSVTGRDAACATGAAGPSLALTPLLNAALLPAATAFDGTALRADASGGVTGLHVGLGSLLGDLDVPTERFVDALAPVSIPLPDALVTTIRLLVPSFPSAITLDLRDAVRAALPGGRLPAADLLSADVLTSTATAKCSAGVGSLSGASTITGLRALGQDVAVVDGLASQTVTALDSARIDLSTLDLSKVSISTSLDGLTGPLLAAVQGLIGPALAALPPIEIPATLVHLTVRAPERVVADGALTQRALHATLSLGGREILDAVVGEAAAGRTGACPPPPDDGPIQPLGTEEPETPAPAPKPVAAARPKVSGLGAADQLLACTDRKLVLLDVVSGGRDVRIRGAADRRLAGRTVGIRLRATGRVVAHAKVGKDGFFTTTAPMPSPEVRASNEARYQALLGREVSLPLKLVRRMSVGKMWSAKGWVTIAGRVALPLADPVSEIRLVRRVSCHKVVLVKRFAPKADGTFTVKVKAPKGASAAVYRLTTSVRKNLANPKIYPTFTLPQGVDLDQR